MPTAARRASSTPATWRPCQSDRHRSRAPGFLQAHRPIEPSSEPRWHHQGPMSIRLNCGQPVMPLKGPLHGLHATLGLRAGGQSPTPGPPCLPAARGHSGRPPRARPGAPHGPAPPQRDPTPYASVGRIPWEVGLSLYIYCTRARDNVNSLTDHCRVLVFNNKTEQTLGNINKH